MPKVLAHRLALDTSSTGVTRFLVLSYFIGLGLGLVEGVDVSVLAATFAPLPVAEFLGDFLVVGLSVLVLVNAYRRASALVLALVVFWASYLTMVVNAGPDQIGAFWRDLALIGALLLTYGGAAAEHDARPASLVKAEPTRRIASLLWPERSSKTVTPRETIYPVRSIPAERTHPKRIKSELYRQDLEVVRLS